RGVQLQFPQRHLRDRGACSRALARRRGRPGHVLDVVATRHDRRRRRLRVHRTRRAPRGGRGGHPALRSLRGGGRLQISTYDLFAGLPLEIESYELAGLRSDVSSGFTRRTTVVSLHGRGETGVGEDVTYDADEHERLQRAGAVHDLAGTHTIDSYSELVGSL